MFGFIFVLLLLVGSSQALPQHVIRINPVDETLEVSVALNRTVQSAITIQIYSYLSTGLSTILGATPSPTLSVQ